MKVKLKKTFQFQSAHFLPNVPCGHKCARLHGHTYTVSVVLKGETVNPEGWLVDFSEISSQWDFLHKILDHNLLNNIPGLENPTSEILSKWIWDKLSNTSIGIYLFEIEVSETPTSLCIYSGD